MPSLTSPNPTDREQAILAILRDRPPDAFSQLDRIASADPVPNLRYLARKALSYLDIGDASLVPSTPPTAPLPDLAKQVSDPSPEVRAALPATLHTATSVAGLPYVLYLMQDPDPTVKARARETLARYRKRDIYTCLTIMVSAADLWKRDTAVYVLAHLSEPEALPLLGKCLSDTSAPIRQKARRGVERFAARNDPRATALLQLADTPAALTSPLADPNPRRRIAALDETIRLKEPEHLDAVLQRLRVEDNPFVLSKLIIACGHLGNEDVAARLLPSLDHDDERIVASVIVALEMLRHRQARARLKRFLGHKCPRILGNTLLYFRDDPEVPLSETLRKMLTGKEFTYKLTALYVLSVLGPGPHWQLVELVLGDINDDVREKAFSLLTTWSTNGHTGARDMLEMCLAGDVAIKTESLRLRRAYPARRLLAFAIDAVLFGLLAALVVVLALNLDPVLGKAVGGIGLAAIIGLFFIRDSHNDGRGVGKSVLGLRVVDLSSNRGCSGAQSLIRQAALGLGILGPVEFIWLHADPAGRRIADHLVNTRVIDEKAQRISALENTGAAFIYLVLASALVLLLPMFGSFTLSGDRIVKGPAGAIQLRMPSGWSVIAEQADAVVAMRRSYYWGNEVEFRMTVTSASALTAAVPTHTLKAEDLVEIGRQIRTAAADTLRKSTRGLVVSEGLETRDRVVAAQPTYGFDLNYTISGRSGVLRGLCFASKEKFYYLQFQSTDHNRLEARMPEINRMLASTRLP